MQTSDDTQTVSAAMRKPTVSEGSVANAGRENEQKELKTRTDESIKKQRFCLLDVSARAWETQLAG